MGDSYIITGNIHAMGETTSYGQNGFTKRSFTILVTGEGENPTYPNYVEFDLVKDKCAILDNFRIGQEIKVNFNIGGRLWSGNGKPEKTFNILTAWKLELLSQDQQQAQSPASDFDESRYMPEAPEDEIPF